MEEVFIIAGSHSSLLPAALALGGEGMLAGFVFAVAFADLLLNFFGDEVDGGVEIGFVVFSVKIRAGHGQADGTFEFAFGGFIGVVFEDDPRIDGKAIQVFQLFDAGKNMVFNGLGQGYVMSR